MFSDKKKSNTTNGNGSKQPNRLGVSTVLNGDIESKEDFRIDGKFEGNFKTSGKLVVGEKGELKGNIYAAQAEIQGKILGDLVVEDLLTVRKTAQIEGNVTTGKLSVESGAIFNATCTMGQAASKSGHVKVKTKKAG